MSIVGACTSLTLTQKGQAAGAPPHVWPSCREKPRPSPRPHAILLASEEAFILMQMTSCQPVAPLTRLSRKRKVQLLLLSVLSIQIDTSSEETTVVLRQYLFSAGLHLAMISRHDWVTSLDPLIRHSLWDMKCCHATKDHFL